MILVHISTDSEQQANDIADFLVSERLILDALHVSGTKRVRNNDGSASVKEHFLVLGKTKGLTPSNDKAS